MEAYIEWRHTLSGGIHCSEWRHPSLLTSYVCMHQSTGKNGIILREARVCSCHKCETREGDKEWRNIEEHRVDEHRGTQSGGA